MRGALNRSTGTTRRYLANGGIVGLDSKVGYRCIGASVKEFRLERSAPATTTNDMNVEHVNCKEKREEVDDIPLSSLAAAGRSFRNGRTRDIRNEESRHGRP